MLSSPPVTCCLAPAALAAGQPGHGADGGGQPGGLPLPLCSLQAQMPADVIACTTCSRPAASPSFTGQGPDAPECDHPHPCKLGSVLKGPTKPPACARGCRPQPGPQVLQRTALSGPKKPDPKYASCLAAWPPSVRGVLVSPIPFSNLSAFRLPHALRLSPWSRRCALAPPGTARPTNWGVRFGSPAHPDCPGVPQCPTARSSEA